jgi:hypothetical protein
VLSNAAQHSDYIAELAESLRDILTQHANSFQSIVVHTSFRLSHSEISAIENATKIAAKSSENCSFAVVKINHHSRFFGFNESANSLVPYESTVVRLSRDEYLIWFEGISYDHPTVSKAFPGPTHLTFIHASNYDQLPNSLLLQDIVNLSGANWRGFNAKSAPVSVFYCHLVADLIRNFHTLKLPLPAVSDMRPWFL